MNWKIIICLFKKHIWNEYPYYGTGKDKWCYRCHWIKEVNFKKEKELTDDELCKAVDGLLDRHERNRLLRKKSTEANM